MENSDSDKEIAKYSSWQLIKDILELIRPYRARFWLATFIRMLGDIAWLYPNFAFASIITLLTKYEQGQSAEKIWGILALLFVAVVLRSVSQNYSKTIGYKVAERSSIDLTLKTIKHLFNLDMAWHEQENSGNKIKRMQNAGDGLNKILRIWFNNIIEITVNLVAMNLIIAQFDKKILLILIIFLVTYFIIAKKITKKASQASYYVNIQEENINGLFFESINNIRTVKVMSMARNLYKTLVEQTNELLKRLGVRIFWYQSRYAILNFWTGIFRIGAIALIVKGILSGHYEIGFLVLFNGYFSELRVSVNELSEASMDFATSRLSIARIKKILNEPIKIEDEKDKLDLPKDWKKISVKNIAFNYGGNQVFNNISFEINRGEKIGIVGVSGVGKSTLFKLLLKEREEFSGDILFDDISIKKIKKSDYFKQVSVVLQETEVFNFSLRDNITITNNEEKENEKLLAQAITTAHISELANKLPNGLDTLIGEKGIKISGGEKQRLGIARAVFKQPEILFLDEATSHLDLESEEKIQDSLHAFLKNVTAVVIAHRLTTIKQMDKILLIENGKIIENGNFEELLSKNGRFKELWEKHKF